VLEAEHFGWGASSRNGGMVLTGLKLPVPVLLSRYGLESVRRMYAASVDSIDCLEEIVRAEKIDCNYARTGHLKVAAKKSHFDSFAASAQFLKREFGQEVRVISKAELPSEIGSKIYFGGIVDDLSAGLNPLRYVLGLASAAKRAGAKMFEHAQVKKIEPVRDAGNRKFRVSCSKGTLLARDVLLASGAYTTHVTPKLRKKVIPIGSYIIATEKLSEETARELVPHNRMIFDSKNFLYYYRLTPDNRMLFGGRAAFFPENENTIRESAEILRRGMIDVYPQLMKCDVEFVWGGTIDVTFDLMPHVGQIDGMYFVVGLAGHGVAMGTYLGKKIADSIAGQKNELPFHDLAFPDAPIGLRSGYTWALPLAEAYHRVLDLVQ
jgi:glycine/D-amino acid oxidase-like deaminating enzyme